MITLELLQKTLGFTCFSTMPLDNHHVILRFNPLERFDKIALAHTLSQLKQTGIPFSHQVKSNYIKFSSG